MNAYFVFLVIWLGLDLVFSFVTTFTPMARTIAAQTPPLEMTVFHVSLLNGNASFGQRCFMFARSFSSGLMFPAFYIVAGIAAVIWHFAS